MSLLSLVSSLDALVASGLGALSAQVAAVPAAEPLSPDRLASPDPWSVDGPWDVVRLLLPAVLAVFTAILVDRMAARRGELPPGFQADSGTDQGEAEPESGSESEPEWASDPGPALEVSSPAETPSEPRRATAARVRRAAATALLAGFFWVGLFAAFSTAGQDVEIDLSNAGAWTLFALHAVIVATLAAWAVLAFPHQRSWRTIAAAFRLAEPRPWREIGVGLVTGVGIWGAVLMVVTGIAVAIEMAGGADLLPQGPPELVGFIAAQPFWVRLLGSLSAGVVEETFFRGFLQPRVGIALSTGLFALAHWSYGEPFMLVGVTLLSLTYAWLARWRRSVWAAATAHAVFDGVQLLILIPLALKAAPMLEELQDAGLAWLLW